MVFRLAEIEAAEEQREKEKLARSGDPTDAQTNNQRR